MAQSYAFNKKYIDAYTTATVGIANTDLKTASTPLRTNIGYNGVQGLVFEKAVAAWHWGRANESRMLFGVLKDDFLDSLDKDHVAAIERNLLFLGTGGKSLRYTDAMKNRFKFPFKGFDTITVNYSSVYQDLFVLAALGGKRKGTFLEIGGSVPFIDNNTALLEDRFNWTGTSIEIRKDLSDEYKAARPNTKVLCDDATKINYEKVLKEIAKDGIVDYLQLDCDPSRTTFEILLSIPFHKYKFGVITYEHDHYLDMTNSYRIKSRKILEAEGYTLVVGNVGLNGCPFEDWWIHPDLVSSEFVAKIQHLQHPLNCYTDVEKLLLLN